MGGSRHAQGVGAGPGTDWGYAGAHVMGASGGGAVAGAPAPGPVGMPHPAMHAQATPQMRPPPPTQPAPQAQAQGGHYATTHAAPHAPAAAAPPRAQAPAAPLPQSGMPVSSMPQRAPTHAAPPPQHPGLQREWQGPGGAGGAGSEWPAPGATSPGAMGPDSGAQGQGWGGRVNGRGRDRAWGGNAGHGKRGGVAGAGGPPPEPRISGGGNVPGGPFPPPPPPPGPAFGGGSARQSFDGASTPAGPSAPTPPTSAPPAYPPPMGPAPGAGSAPAWGAQPGPGYPPRPGANRLPLPVDATQPRGAYADAGMGARSPGAGMRGPGGGPGPAAFGAPPPGHPVFAPDDRISSMVGQAGHLSAKMSKTRIGQHRQDRMNRGGPRGNEGRGGRRDDAGDGRGGRGSWGVVDDRSRRDGQMDEPNEAVERAREALEKARAKAQAEFGNRRMRANPAAVDAELASLVAALEPTDEDRRRLADAHGAVQRIVGLILPGAEVAVFGSAANGLGVRSGNDIDLTILAPVLWALPHGDPAPRASAGEAVEVRMEAVGAGVAVSVRARNGAGAGAADAPGGDDERLRWPAEEFARAVHLAGHLLAGHVRVGDVGAASGPAPAVSPQEAAALGGIGKGGRSPRTEGHARLLAALLERLSRCGEMQVVLELITARIPVLKLRHVPTGVTIDLTVNNYLALSNTRLLHQYTSIDPRARHLCLIVKHWAKRRAVNEPFRGTLSSYAYVIMCIHLLQTRRPPVLPCLQDGDHEPVMVDGWDVWHKPACEALAAFDPSRNTQSLSSLLFDFFKYWHVEHDYWNDVATIRVPGGSLTKEAKRWDRRVGVDNHRLCVEDPFQLDHNLARVVDKSSLRAIQREIRSALAVLCDLEDPLPKLFEEFALMRGPMHHNNHSHNHNHNQNRNGQRWQS